jgi:DNA-binding response OmpR family regulator
LADLEQLQLRHRNGEPECLTEREAALLAYFARNPERVISRDEILRHVWRLNPRGMTTRTVDMHVAKLREKLGRIEKDPQLLITVRNRGYRFNPPVSKKA